MYFVEHFCEMATRENHLNYVRMIQRDILMIVDGVAPADGSGAANVKHVRRVLQGLQDKNILSSEKVAEISSALKERETNQSNVLDKEGSEASGTPASSKASSTMRVDKRQIEQRIEEDRERNKRLRENMWAVIGDNKDEYRKLWDETSDVGEDDFLDAEEELGERKMAVATWFTWFSCRYFYSNSFGEGMSNIHAFRSFIVHRGKGKRGVQDLSYIKYQLIY